MANGGIGHPSRTDSGKMKIRINAGYAGAGAVLER